MMGIWRRGKTTLLLSLVLLTLLAGACGGDRPAEGEMRGTITVSGAWALYPMMVRWSEEFHELYPQIDFDISAGGAGKGMTDALSGAVDIGMVSREIYETEIEQGALWFAATKDAVLPTINATSPHLARIQAQGLPRATLEDIWMGRVQTWGELVGDPAATQSVHVYTRSDACGAAATWAEYLGDYDQEDLLGVAVYSDPGLTEAVTQDPLGVGYSNLNFAYDAHSGKPVDGLAIIPIDVNENGRIDPEEDFYATKRELTVAISEGRYPSPPARDLYLVTQGVPEGITAAFIRWILSDGQAFVDETGYIGLTEAQLQGELAKLGD
jgi:phosphate transport system substrate-binding protein